MTFVRMDRDRYHLVKGLLTDSEAVFLPQPLSILEGIIDGVVFVDNQDHPACAAVLSTDFRWGRLIGRVTNVEFNKGFVSTMKSQYPLENGGQVRGSWSTVSETWDDLIYDIFGYRMFRIDRTQFRFDRVTFESLGPTEDLDGLRRIDSYVIESDEALHRNVVGLWGSVDNYLQNGAGWIALSSSEKIIGRCDAAFVGGGLAELAIHVVKSARGSGLGYHLARKFIEDCLTRNVTPNWACDTQNIPSFRMAEKLGYKPEGHYYLFTSVYTPMHHEPPR